MIIELARKARGWTQTQLAKAAGTSQATESSYERHEKSPSLGVVERLVGRVGYTRHLDHSVDFNQFYDGTNTYWIPDALWRVDPRLRFSKVKVPDGVAHQRTGEWQQRYFNLADRDDRRRVYQYVLQASIPVWIWRWIDGALLVEMQEEFDLPRLLRIEWQPLIDHARNVPMETPIDIAYDETMKNRAPEHRAEIAARQTAREAAAAAIVRDNEPLLQPRA